MPPYSVKVPRRLSRFADRKNLQKISATGLELSPHIGLTVLTGNHPQNCPRKEHAMHPNLAAQLTALQQASVSALRVRYAELFGEPTPCRHKTWLVKRLAWRLQALAEGDLTERARLRAEQLAND